MESNETRRRPRVWVCNWQDRKDYTGASVFGELIALTRERASIFLTDSLTEQVVRGLEEFKEDDFLLLCGPPLISFVAGRFLLERFSKVNVVLFNAATRGYEPRTITAKQVIGRINGISS
jgi:hypothetical protein